MHPKRSKKYRPPHPVRKFYHKRPKHRIPFWNEFGLMIITYEHSPTSDATRVLTL